MRRRDGLRLGLGLLLASGVSTRSWAAYQTCGGQKVDNDIVRCPDGSIPSYAYGDPPAPKLAAPPRKAASSDPRQRFLGIWHTPVEGIGHQTPFDVPGSSAIDTNISLRAGDLTIAANGAFVWNTLTGSYGRWIAFREGYWDFMLIDTRGTSWRGRVEDDGRVRLRLGDTLVFGTR
jgi:hypothetical protein